MQIIITGKGVDLTDAIEEYVLKRVNGLEKFFKGIVRAEVTLGHESNRHVKGDDFFAECKLEVPGKDVFAKQTAKILYEAIDLMRDTVGHDLKKHKIKLRGNVKKRKLTARKNKEYTE